MNTRLRHLVPVGLVLALTLAGFFIAREHGKRDAAQESTHSAEIAATRVRDRVAQATTLTDGLRRFLAGHVSSGVTTEQLADIGARWLSPVGVSAAAWARQVPQRPGYLPATLVTGSPPMSTTGIDLGGFAGIAAAVARPQSAYRASATPLEHLPDGTSGVFLVQSAQRVNYGVVEPGFVVLFIPASWLLAAATDRIESTPAAGPTPEISVGGVSAGNLSGAATAQSAFTAAGQPFEVRVARLPVQADAKALPWIILAAGLALAVFAGALGVTATRRTKAKAEVDRLFNISPDVIVVAGFDGYFKRVNPAFEELLGYTEQEALSRPYVDFVHPDDRQLMIANDNELREGETTVSFEDRYVCKNGSFKWLEWTATPVLKERLIYAVARDVTERRQAETDLREAEERNRALADEQAALRRVATLVAQGTPSEELFAAVVAEVLGLLPVETISMGRYGPDDTISPVAIAGAVGDVFPIGSRWPLGGNNVSTMVAQTKRPARIDTYDDAHDALSVAIRAERLGAAVGAPIIVEGCLWGVMTASAGQQVALPPDIEGRLVSFTELVATAIANADSRAKIAELAEEQAALRRVATLVARSVPPDELFAAVTEEVGQLLPVSSAAMGRFDPDGMFTTVAAWSTGTVAFPVGRRWITEGKNVMTLVVETGRPARIDDFADASGPVGVAAREAGYRSAVGTPIVVEGHLWGVMSAASTAEQPLPLDTETRLASFTELVATAIANSESRAGLARLAEEQAALRRVATLVAQGVPPAEVFAAVAVELAHLFDAQSTTIGRLEPDGTMAIVANHGISREELQVGTLVPLDKGMAVTEVLRTGRPAFLDDFTRFTNDVQERAQRLHLRCILGVPIFVEGALWGSIGAAKQWEDFPADAEQRMAQFTELAATAIANAESRSEVAASRARIVAASDETRRRIERDLHDGTQQRLVSLGLELRLAESTVSAELEEPRGTIGRVARELDEVIEELREISRGIHPAILSEGGLGPALRTLARRSAIPVELGDVIADRLPEPIEVAAYYVLSEALTNATKHANASRVDIEASVRDSTLRLSIRDEGVGGADPAGGSGLVGLRDRVDALGGSIEISSPPGQGTHVVAKLPVELDLTVAPSEDNRPDRVPASR